MSEWLVEQHFESVTIAWITVDHARTAGHYSLRDFGDVHGKLQSCFVGLQLSGDHGWGLAAERLKFEEPGEIFVASVLSFRSRNQDRINLVLEAVSDSAVLRRAFISALAWLPWDMAGPFVNCCSESSDPFLRYAGVAAFEIHRRDPAHDLTDWLDDCDVDVRARAFQSVGTLGRSDLFDTVTRKLDDRDEAVRAGACWTAALRLRHDTAITRMLTFARANGRYTDSCARLLMSVLTAEQAWDLIQEFTTGNHQQVRLAIILIGLLGIPDSAPWLIEMMAHPPYARVAGESFYRITGLRLDQRPFEGDWPEGFEAGPNDDPEDENVEMDEDEDLPWPEPVPIAAWWEENRSRFRSNVRYLLGFELDNEAWLRKILVLGRQRERATAALELAIRHPTEPLFNVEEHGRRQMKKLGVKRLPTEEYRCNHIEAGPDDHSWKKYLRKPK